MSDDILKELRNKRTRSTVEPRQDALVPKVQPETPKQNSQPEPSLVTEPPNPTATPADTIAELKTKLEKYPKTRRHSGIILEEDLDQELTRFCRDRGITVEVFLEAAWIFANADNTLLEKITSEAKRRYDRRKQVGQIKRLITMLSNSAKV